MNDPVAKNLERALEAARRRVDPLAEDRSRISERLRAELGAEIVDGAVHGPGPARLPGRGPARVVPGPARAVIGRNGWLAAVVGTGIVTGAIGFVLGYGLGLGDRLLGLTSPPGAQTEAGAQASASPSWASSSGVASPAPASVGAPPDGVTPTTPREPAAPAVRDEPAVRKESAPAAVKRPAPRVLVTAANEPAAPIGQPALAPRLAFAEVVERLRRANLALGDAKPALAIIELRELDRLAGDTLREERDMTHLLASCAVGDVDEATRRARRLLALQTSSIYAPRIERSCAREGSR